MATALRFAARSNVGLLRQGNEDSGYAGPRLLVVADGMGGHVAGEVASSVAVATMASLDEDSPGPDLLGRLRAAVEGANEQLRLMVGGDPHLEGMGTTLTAVLRSGSRLGIVHVGDSRAYLLRDGRLEQITHDHTFVQTLVDEGRITREEADHHPQRSLITRALDGRGDVEPDLSVREARPGDRYLLCSDGLSSVVSEDTIRDTLAGLPDPERACDALVDYALRGGGPDNITVVLADVVDTGASPSQVPHVVGAVADGRGDHPALPVQQRPASAAQRAAALSARPTPAEDDVDDGPAPEPRAPRWPLITLLVLIVLAAVGAATGGWVWSQQQYYVGADGANVAIYRGLPQELAGINLSSVERREDVVLTALSPYSRQQVEAGISADDLADAERTIDQLRQEAAECSAVLAPATCRATDPFSELPVPDPTPARSASPASTPQATPTPGRTTRTTPSAARAVAGPEAGR
ncbi:Stp1/IreP family PP2C-type Ser/Thr phosphatase [Motilibacter aurantiacus]|uniref:Stp1/IreP family PP2C-type Ser/Thr phosphatase n=1 Tax=Motilibacter aurantiacus TaxID=2714955 RepID=UPI001409CC09|nr:Stp1/IreP family PP2C-type Ser/Thr phosphatase [Motilibacter aurantiacus]NHC46431.1 Stp1/IreP family PP2C-type Ser/Thr phosphatase [Motilibacter aurantiacus]